MINIASTKLKKESFKSFDEEAGRRKEKVCNRAEQCKNFDEEKELGDGELQPQIEKEEEDIRRH